MLRRVVLSVAVVLALVSVPAAAELAAGSSERTTVTAPTDAHPKADFAREALRPSTPVVRAVSSVRRLLQRLVLFLAALAAVLAAAAAFGRRPRRAAGSPHRPGRAWPAAPTRAPPAIA